MFRRTMRALAASAAVMALPLLVGPAPAQADPVVPLAAATPTAGAPVRIMPLGDSITGSPGCWRQLLWQKLQDAGHTGVDMVGSLNNSTSCGTAFDGDNEGHGGYLATDIAAKDQLPAWLETADPDVVLMHLGTNDLWSAKTTDAVLGAYGTLVKQMRAQNPTVAVLVARIIPVAPDNDCAQCPQRTVDLNNAIPAWAKSLSTADSPVVPVDLWSDWDPIADTGDGVHPNKSGIAKMADRWYAPLASLLGGTVPAPSTEAFTYVAGTATRTTTTKPPIVASSTARKLFSFEKGTEGWVAANEGQATATTAFHTDGAAGLEFTSTSGDWVGGTLPGVENWSGNPAVTYDVRTAANGTSTNIAIQTGDDWDWCQGTNWGWVPANTSTTVTIPLNDMTCPNSERPADLTMVRRIHVFLSGGTFQLDNVALSGLAQGTTPSATSSAATPSATVVPAATQEPVVATTTAAPTASAPATSPATPQTVAATLLFSFEKTLQRFSAGAHDTTVRLTDAFHTDGTQGVEISTTVADGDWIGSQFQPAADFAQATVLTYDLKAGESGTSTNVAIQTGDEWAWCTAPDWPWVPAGETRTITIDLSTVTCGDTATFRPAKVQKINIFVQAGTHYLDNVRTDADVPIPAETIKPVPAGLTEVTDFGANPSGARMYLHVPTMLDADPGVLVVNHWCTGDGITMYSDTEFRNLSDRYGFIALYPSSTNGDMCWDVASPKTLTHDGGGDSNSIANMVRYVLDTYDADPERVYSTGISSGAMMTNVLLATYPDLFAGGAAFAGVPHSCFGGPTRWNNDCATGKTSRTAEEWGDLVRDAHPGYTGPRPRMQLWHGENDTVLHYNNFAEEIKQWTNVHGLSATPTATDTPQTGWTRTRYADADGVVQVEAISIAGVPHDLMRTGMAAQAVAFFGLDD